MILRGSQPLHIEILQFQALSIDSGDRVNWVGDLEDLRIAAGEVWPDWQAISIWGAGLGKVSPVA